VFDIKYGEFLVIGQANMWGFLQIGNRNTKIEPMVLKYIPKVPINNH
jgi:hypothetical protein